MFRRAAAAAIGLLIIGLAGCSQSDTEPKLTATGSPGVPAIVGPTHADEMRTWRAKIQPALEQLSKDLTWMKGAFDSFDFADARAAARQYETDLDNLQSHLPSPDDRVTRSITDAINNYRAFARGCQGASPQTPNDDIQQLKEYHDRGDASLQAALDILDHPEQN